MTFVRTNQILHSVVHESSVHVCTCVSHCSTVFHYIKMPQFTYFHIRTFTVGDPRVCHFYLDESVGYLGLSAHDVEVSAHMDGFGCVWPDELKVLPLHLKSDSIFFI